MAVSTGLTGPNERYRAGRGQPAGRRQHVAGGNEIAPALWRRLAAPAAGRLITLPGRPVRLRVTASLAPGPGPSLAPVTLTASVMDAPAICSRFRSARCRPTAARTR